MRTILNMCTAPNDLHLAIFHPAHARIYNQVYKIKIKITTATYHRQVPKRLLCEICQKNKNKQTNKQTK